MQRRWLARIALAASLVAIGPGNLPASAAEKPETSSKPISVFLDRLAVDQKVQDIGWKLVTGNAAYCEGAVQAVGLQLQDMASYGDPAGVRALFGLGNDFAVLTAARGSPAEAAGLSTNDEVLAIDGTRLSDWPTKPKSDWRRAVRAHDLIDRRLAETGAVTLALEQGGEVRLEAVPACPSRFEMGGDGKRAMAEGTRVIIEREFPGLAYVEDELAAAIAHELAHNLLRHRAWLDANGRKQRNIRLTEREADRLMPWLLANAGYDPSAAKRFMERWGPRHSGGLFRKRSHDGWDERSEFIDAELAEVQQARSGSGSADWKTHFRREIEPGD